MIIGIGVTTYNRPECIKRFRDQLEKNPPKYNYKYYEAHDNNEERLGIAKRKNECLRALKDCDYIFLFDDDCWPIKEGWDKAVIEQAKDTDQNHFMYLKETYTIRKQKTVKGLGVFNNCAGCMLFITKEVIIKVGGFNEGYKVYGYEHAGYSQRIHKAGLTPLGCYLAPVNIREFIYSMDYDTGQHENHESSITIEEVSSVIQANSENFKEDLKTINQPL